MGSLGIVAAAVPPIQTPIPEPPEVVTVAPGTPQEFAQPPSDGSGTGDGSGGIDGEPGGVAGVPGIPCGTLKTPACTDPPTLEPTTERPEPTTPPDPTKPTETTPPETTPPTITLPPITLPPITLPPITLPPTTAPQPTTPPTTEAPPPPQDPPTTAVPPGDTSIAPPSGTEESTTTTAPPMPPPIALPPIPPLPGKAVLQLTPSAITPGDEVTASGAGCLPRSPVTLTVDGTLVGSATAGDDGAFRAPLSLSSVEVGRYEVTARCGPNALTAPLDVILISRISSATSTLTVIIFFLLLGGWFYGHRLASHVPVRRRL